MQTEIVANDLLDGLRALCGEGGEEASALLAIVEQQPTDVASVVRLAVPVFTNEFPKPRGAFCLALGMLYEALERGFSGDLTPAPLRELGPAVFAMLEREEIDGERSALQYLFAHFPDTVTRSQLQSLGGSEFARLQLAIRPASFTARTLSFADAQNCPDDPQELERLWRSSRDCLWSYLGAQAYWLLCSHRLTEGAE